MKDIYLEGIQNQVFSEAKKPIDTEAKRKLLIRDIRSGEIDADDLLDCAEFLGIESKKDIQKDPNGVFADLKKLCITKLKIAKPVIVNTLATEMKIGP